MARAENLSRYYRVPADGRDLNYNKYFNSGETEVSSADDYTSHNTERLNVEGMKQLLLKLDFIQQQLRS